MSAPTATLRHPSGRGTQRSLAQEAPTAGRERSSRQTEQHGRLGRLIFGVPARFMAPRLLVYACTFVLVAFGILMIYSASSITAMNEEVSEFNSAYYGLRQLRFAGIGLVLAIFVAITDYHLWAKKILLVVWLVTLGLLALIFTAAIGAGAYGATRWITIAGFTLQPSELAKVTVILTMANILSRYMEDPNMSVHQFARLLILGVGVPLVAILLQPDKGTTIICGATCIVMAFLAGIKKRWILTAVLLSAAAAIVLSLRDEYSRERVMMAWNPWADEWGAGYQLIQGYYAFSSGGLFGVGIGLSRQKYSYLPMAHNDFIFAIIGEELGLVGTLGMLALFALLVWASFQIAKHASDLLGRLIAAGCASLIAIQLFVNVGGVLGLIPLTGKPVPFISYGGTSIISCLLLVGFVVSVSRHSTLPQTVFDARRRDYGVAAPVPSAERRPVSELSLVGEPTPRSARAASVVEEEAQTVSSPMPAPKPLQLTVLGGGRSSKDSQPPDASDRSPEALRASREFAEKHRQGRVSVDSKGRTRIDLGPDAASRLRGR